MTLTGDDGKPNEWVKLGITLMVSSLSSAIGASIIVWNLLQDHEVRIQVIDAKIVTMKESLDGHTRWHETQYDTITRKLTEIQVDIGRIQGERKNGR